MTSAAGAAASDTVFTTAPLGESVSVLQGYECNIVASAGDDGIILVDTCDERVSTPLLAAVQRLSGKPLRFAIDTHVHADHTGGNATFQKLAPVIASSNVRKWMISGNEKTRDKPSAPEALPVITFEGEMTLYYNGEEIRLLKLSPAHTDGDVVVFFKKANVVALGDVYMSPAASFGDRWYGGGFLGLIEAMEFVLPQIPDDAKVVPGHGTISTRANVVHGLDVLKQMKTVVEKGIRDGQSLEQLTAARVFDQFRSSVPTWASSEKSMDGWLKNFHREITARRM